MTRFHALVLLLISLVLAGFARAGDALPTAVMDSTQVVVRVTGYCNCGECCGWRRSWFGLGRPVYARGPLKGKPKNVGVTTTGARAKTGTIAADPRVFPFGTRLVVPGYGEGVVEDTGGAVVGRHIDVWFPTHAAARKWGTRTLKIDVKPTVKLENSSSSR